VNEAVRARTKSVDETRALAAELASLVVPGDIIVLAGDLGAGKTAFVQGFAKALGVTEHVTSPTFILVRRYDDATIPLIHVDAYRLDHLQELVDVGLPELLDDGGVTLIEWGDLVVPILPADYLEIRLALTDAIDERTLVLRGAGRTWPGRMPGVELAVGRWAAEGD
jgi:tRNA threonylcarbamoyladenosine biosynthesis protein TsaE